MNTFLQNVTKYKTLLLILFCVAVSPLYGEATSKKRTPPVRQNYTPHPQSLVNDTDGDGKTDDVDLDDDNDGILDSVEAPCVSPLDGVQASVPGAVSNYPGSGTALFTGTFSYTGTSSKPIYQINLFSTTVYATAVFPDASSTQTTLFSKTVYNLDCALDDMDKSETATLRFYDSNGNLITNIAQYITHQGSNILNITYPANQSVKVQAKGATSTGAPSQVRFTFTADIGISRIEYEQTSNANSAYNGFGMMSGCLHPDTDNDSTPDYLDTDSDNDGCPDAIEGGAAFTLSQVDANGRLTGGIDANGIPTSALPSGQTVGDSQNASVQDVNCALAGVVTSTQPTCSNTGSVNSDGIITLTSYSGNSTKAGYSVGSSYTGPAFASATAVTTAPMILVSTLPNPTTVQPYTIRIFKDATTYIDRVVLLTPIKCAVSDLSVSISPTQTTVGKDEYASHTITVSNAGPNAADNVVVKVTLPAGVSYVSSTAQQGSYTDADKLWHVGTVAVGTPLTLTVSYKGN